MAATGKFSKKKSYSCGIVSSRHRLYISIRVSDISWLLVYRQEWGESHIIEEMHKKGSLGPAEGVVEYGVIQEANHNEFSDMCMMTPLWLARGVGVAGNRHPVETAREIEEKTWKFVSSVLGVGS